MMKRNFVMLGIAAMIGAVALAGPVAAKQKKTCADITLPEPKNSSKVTLCHFTGSDSNPFIINEVSVSGAESHLLNPDHHGDCGNYGADVNGGIVLCVQ